MTMSTYKSLGGPPSGLLLTNDPHLAERVDAIAFPGLTANFDAAKSASLALDLLTCGIGLPLAPVAGDVTAFRARFDQLHFVRA
jgi:hypothetical protein